MKILSLKPYFQPEQFSSRHLGEAILRRQVEAGHTVEIYVPTPTRGVSKEVRREYKKRKRETLENGAVVVRRFALFGEGRNPLLRAIRYFLCELQFAWFGFWAKDVDVFPVGSTPPIHALVAVFLKKTRGIPYVFTINDLFPESLVSAGLTRKGSLLWKIGSVVSNISYKSADQIVVISNQIKRALVEKGVPEDKILVRYNWIDEKTTRPIPRDENALFDEFNLPRDKFYVTYAGNLGASQNVELLVQCAQKLKDDSRVRFVIFGEGTEKEKLTKSVESLQLKNVDIFPMQPLERVSEVYSLGNISLVACKKGVGGGAFPSKAVSIMATATPALVSFDEDSDLVSIVKEAQTGICVEPEDPDAAVDAIRTYLNDAERCERDGQNARRLVCERFSQEAGLEAVVRVQEETAQRKGAAKRNSKGKG